MKFAILSGNPKETGLCRSVTDEIIRGAKDGSAEVQETTMGGIERCHMCGEGWGDCISQHKCAYGDDGFNEAQEIIKQADALAIITPVYFSEVTDGLKSFIDRLRRCEFALGPNAGKSILFDKPVLLVASAGGSGRGLLTALGQLERFCDHTGAMLFDSIGVSRWSGDYKREAAYNAAKAIAGGRRVEIMRPE
jgi:multimeric flavodoxin WrbA